MSTDTISAAELREDQDAQATLDARIARVSTKRACALVERIARIQADVDTIRGAAAGVENPELLADAHKRVAELRWGLCEALSEVSDGFIAPGVFHAGFQHSLAMRADHPIVTGKVVAALARVETVPNQALREATIDFLDRTGIQWTDLVHVVGERLLILEREHGVGDGAYGSSAWITTGKSDQQRKWAADGLRMALGTAVELKDGRRRCPFLISYHRAVAITQVLGIPPHELGV